MVAFLVALADAQVPVQADGIPEGLQKKLQPGKISGFLSLGNVGPSVVRVLKRVATDIRFVAGDDENESHLPATQVLEVEGVRVGMVHGHLVMPKGSTIALDAVRRWLSVDVLLSASTGRASTQHVGEGLLVDPGSITGINCSPLATEQASFCLLSIDGGKVTTFTYTLQPDRIVSFQRHDFKRTGGLLSAPSLTAATSSVALQENTAEEPEKESNDVVADEQVSTQEDVTTGGESNVPGTTVSPETETKVDSSLNEALAAPED